ncbi:MAG TPA: hypothetical protein VFW33_16765, partial [Gemmataceae bacterium]|nr:hypothetical protein [Gemmataceae bacterium]
MNRKWKYWLGVAAAAGLAGAGRAQVAAPPPPAAVAVPAAPAPAAVPVDPNMPGGMMGNLIKTCAYCKAKCCNSQLGQLLNNTLRPVSALSGGLVPPLCPPNAVNPADLGLPPDSPAGAAARIKADQAGAAARVAAVRYLAHVDCHYWPEAQAALITALRADRNECVRLAAAIALQTGCCCNPATMTALTITVSGGEEDGNPSETSDRVKSAASVALENCLSRVPPAPPLELLPPPVVPDMDREKERREKGREQLPPPDPDGPAPAGGTGPVSPVTFYQQAEKASSAAVIRKARQALEQNKLHPPVAAAAPAGALGSQGLVGLAMNAMGSTPSAPASPAGVATVPAPAPVVMAPTPAAPADVRRVEAVKDQQPPLVPVPAPARQPAAPPAPAHARPVIPTPAPA